MSAVTKFSDVQLRKDWGARHRNGFGARSIPVTLWLHHTVTTHLPESATVAQERAQMRVLEDIGQQRFGGGVSYNWILFPSGRLYQGIGVRRRGAHTLGHNVTGMAVALAGNYQNAPMTEAQLQTLTWFLPFAKKEGWIREARFNGGHRDAPGNSTACPGNRAHAQIAEVHRRVAGGSASPKPASGGSSSTSSSSSGSPNTNPKTGTGVSGRFLQTRSGGTVNIRSKPDSRSSGNIVGTVRGGELVRRDSSPDTRHFYGVGDRWYVGKTVASPVRADGRNTLVVGDWPGREMPINGVNTFEMNAAWRELLARVGISKGSRTAMMQRWLKSKGQNPGPVDGIEGPLTYRALQTYLNAQGFNAGAVDGIRGQATHRAEKRFLNSQIKHLGSKWPQHYRN